MSRLTRVRQVRRRTITTLVVVVVAIAVVVGGFWFLAQGPGVRLLSPPQSTVAEFSGTGDQSTPAFGVRNGWRIHWQSTGERFSMAIRGDQDLGTVIESGEPATGVTSPAGAGTFHLDISADGSWSIRIEQGD